MEIDYTKLKRGDVVHHNIDKNKDGTCKRWRVSGKTKTWKTRPGEFRIPIKHGLYRNYYIDHENVERFHDPDYCDAFIASQVLLGRKDKKFQFLKLRKNEKAEITILTPAHHFLVTE